MRNRLIPKILLLLGLFSCSVVRVDAQELRSETELIAILQADDAAAKALACKHLAVQGTAAAVPELAKLLSDEQLASWARIALEAIPEVACDEALRTTAASLQGNLLVGAINSLGVRRDAQSVETLQGYLTNQDNEVAASAAVSLGQIGNAAATEALQKALEAGGSKAPAQVRSAIAEGLVLCGERYLAEGNDAEAVAVYDLVRKSDVAQQRRVEATRGAILARKQQGIPLLIEQLNSPEKVMFQIALATAREFPGSEVDKALAAELGKAPADRAALLITAMADRTSTVELSAIQKAAESGEKNVRLSAISALGRVGNVSCVSPLLNIAQQSDAELVNAAKAALSELPDDKVDQEIVNRLGKADASLTALLISVVGQRRIEATDELTKSLASNDKAVRVAALSALGETVPAGKLPVLIAQVVAPKTADDAVAAVAALKTAAVRMPDREACATLLAAEVERVPVATKVTLLEILGAVGGTKALETVGAAGKSTDVQLKDASSRLLGDWMTIDAAPVLLDLAKTSPPDKFQVRSVRGYIRIARQFSMDENERIKMCQNAFDIAKQPADRKLVLELLKRYPNLETLKLSVKATELPDLKEEATQTALAIAQKLDGKPEVNEILAKAGIKK